MEVVYDKAKNERNVRERGLSFERAYDFEIADAVVIPYFRNGEWREVAFGYLDDRLHVLCFIKSGDVMRVISFRKANIREATRHGKDLRKIRR